MSTFIIIDDGSDPMPHMLVNTDSELTAAQLELYERGIAEADVCVGDPGSVDCIKNGQVVYASAPDQTVKGTEKSVTVNSIDGEFTMLVKLSNGRKSVMTMDHLVAIPGGGFVAAGSLNPGEAMRCWFSIPDDYSAVKDVRSKNNPFRNKE